MHDVWTTHEGDFHLAANGKVKRRVAAGGHGGGITSYVDEDASGEQALAYFRHMAEVKASEADVLMHRHEQAETEIAERQEIEAEAEEISEDRAGEQE